MEKIAEKSQESKNLEDLNETIPANYREIIEEDFLTSFKFKKGSLQYKLMRVLFKRAFSSLSQFLIEMDGHLANSDVPSTARLALERLSSGLIIQKEAQIPAEGPVLVVSNHPGWVDSLVALAGLSRPDLYYVAGTHPTLGDLPNVRKQAIFVDQKGTNNRAEVIRTIIGHLKAGRVVVIFPMGKLEPDPALMSGAVESIREWNDSLGIFLNKVPETIVQPMLISQLLLARAWNHWAIQLFKDRRRRQQLSYAMQFALSLRKKRGLAWKVRPRIDFGKAVSVRELSASLDPRQLSQAVKERMIDLLLEVYPAQALSH